MKETERHENFPPPGGLIQHGTKTGRLPAWAGRRYRDIHVTESKDRAGETVIHFDDPSGSLEVRLDAADLAALRETLAGPTHADRVAAFLIGFSSALRDRIGSSRDQADLEAVERVIMVLEEEAGR